MIAHVSLLLLLSTPAFSAAPEPRTLYFQVPHTRFHEKADARSKVLDVYGYGSDCETDQAPAGGWQALTCGENKGFVRAAAVGPKAPSKDEAWKAAEDEARPLAERLRATKVMLADHAGGSQELRNLWEGRYRTLYYEQKFRALTAARAAKKTRPKPYVVVASDRKVQAAIVAVLEGTPLTKTGKRLTLNVEMRGDDFVAVSFTSSGRLLAESGRAVAGAKGVEVTVELGASFLPWPEQKSALVLTTLGLPNTCADEPLDANSVPVCAIAEEQNCSPDGCWGPYQECNVALGGPCASCVAICRGGCSDCHVACVGKSADCADACLAAATQCNETCVKTTTTGLAKCEGTFKGCSTKQKTWVKKNCPKQCAAKARCENKCDGDSDCEGKCYNKFSFLCQYECN